MAEQGGVALITVLLVVALASLTATSLASLTQFELRRTGLVLQEQQTRWYLQGAEQWATQVLARSDIEIDHPGEDWARVLPPLPVDGGFIAGGLSDLQGRFNLNNLIADDADDPTQLALLQRLLDRLALPQGLAQAIADWIDADREPRFPDGAEDSDYLARDPPYLAANRPLASISELLLIRGFDGVSYQRLAPLVTALPEPTPINVNTAPVELLGVLDSRLDGELAGRLDRTRRERPFASVAEFIAATGLDGLELPETALSVRSDFFLLAAAAEIGAARGTLQSLLYRNEAGLARSLRRSYGDAL